MNDDDLRSAEDWLAAKVLEQDRPIVLFQLVCSRLYELKIERPGLTLIEQILVGAARSLGPNLRFSPETGTEVAPAPRIAPR